MSTPTIEVLEPGMLTTVQDLGRFGYQRYGVPVSGAMDGLALRAANLLVGNDAGAAALELTMLGPKLGFLADTWISVTGADMSASLDGEPLPAWEAVEVSRGSQLTLHSAELGMRAYLAIAGGIDVPLVMGSRSTYAPGGLGGLDGRALRSGDLLPALPLNSESHFVPWYLPDGFRPQVRGGHQQLRVVLGPQHGAFTSEAISTLLGSEYAVSLESDRMGYRLDGPVLAHRAGPDIVSDGNPPGAIQVPGEGTPTILMADRGTTGGYAKIATVIGADLRGVAQVQPGQSVSFAPVTIDEAHRAFREMVAVLDKIEERKPPPLPKLSVAVDGEAFRVEDEDGGTVTKQDLIAEPASTRSLRARATPGGTTYEFDVEVRREG